MCVLKMKPLPLTVQKLYPEQICRQIDGQTDRYRHTVSTEIITYPHTWMVTTASVIIPTAIL